MEGKGHTGKKDLEEIIHSSSFVTFLLGRQKSLTNIYEYQFIIIIGFKLGHAWEVFAHKYSNMSPNCLQG